MSSNNNSIIHDSNNYLDNHLYEIGLLPVSLRSDAKPRYLNHPVTLFLVNLLFFITKFLCILTDNQNITMLIALGDFTHKFSTLNYMNIVYLLLCFMWFNSQLIYYYNHKRCIEPTFLRVFRVMSGSVDQISDGLIDEKQMNGLKRLSHRLFNYLIILNKYITTVLKLFYIYPIYIHFITHYNYTLYTNPSFHLYYTFVQII